MSSKKGKKSEQLKTRKKVADNRKQEPAPVPQAVNPFWWPAYGDQALPNVTDQSLVGLPAAGYCVNLVANAVATIGPAKAYDEEDNEITPTPLILAKPVVGQSPFNTYADMVRALLVHGNACYIPLGFDEAGNITQVAPLPPNSTRIYIDDAGYKVFECGELKLNADEVIHFAINTQLGNGGIGIGVVEQYRRSIGLQLDQQLYAAGTYKNAGVPPSIISIDADKITTAQADAVREAWLTANGTNRRAPAVVAKAMKFETVAFTPEDMEFLASRQFSVSEMAFMFGISPGYLGASIGGTSLTYENLQGRSVQLITESVGPFLRVLEESFSEILPGASYAEFTVERYMRLSPAERDAHYESAIRAGWLTKDEVREIEGLSPLPKPEPKPFALGGIIKPNVNMIGEAGPETVVPGDAA